MDESRKPLKALIAVGIFLLVYAFSAFLVFDFGEPARPMTGEYRGGKTVAIGPRPRGWACAPSSTGGYTGAEWPFLLYAPVCSIYLSLSGHAPHVDLTPPPVPGSP